MDIGEIVDNLRSKKKQLLDQRVKLTSESVKSSSLTLECIYNVECCHCLAAGVLRVCYGVTHNVLQEDLENTTGLVIDETADSLNSSSSSQTTDCWLCNSLDVLTNSPSMPLFRSHFAESFATLRFADHD
jgi:hypothetical protein